MKSLMTPREEYGLGSLVSKALEKFFTPSEETSSSESSKPMSEMLIIGNPSSDSPSFFRNEKGQVTPELIERATNNFKQLQKDGFQISENIDSEGYRDYFAKKITPNSAEIYPIDTETWTIKPSNYRRSNMESLLESTDGRYPRPRIEPPFSKGLKDSPTYYDRAPQIQSDGGYIKKQEGGEMAMPSREGYQNGGDTKNKKYDASKEYPYTDEKPPIAKAGMFQPLEHLGVNQKTINKLTKATDIPSGLVDIIEIIVTKAREKGLMDDPAKDQKQEGGEMAMPPELMEQDVPVDTYPNMTPEEEAMPIASDEQMQEDYVDYVTAEVLTTSEQDYLNAALDNDPQLESILDKVVTYATEFTGEGEVDGPGTGISDSIPARLSDGEFVITEKATDQIGADNLQTMMDEAERAADGGMMQKYALGGAVDNPMLGGAVKDTTPLMDEKTGMYGTTRQDDEMKKQMMYANRMPSIIGR